MNHVNGGNTVSLKKKKKSGRFNFIDFILIVIVLLLIAAVIYAFAPFSRIQNLTGAQVRNIQYTVEFTGVDEAFIDKIKENDLVVDSVSKNQMGSVVAVDYNHKYTELQYVVTKDADGVEHVEGILSEYPNLYNVIVTIYASADYSAGSGYTVNHTRIAVGEAMSLRFPDYLGEGHCIGVVQS